MIGSLFVALGAMTWISWTVRLLLLTARMFQIEEYEAPRLISWSRQKDWQWQRPILYSSVLAVVIGLAGLFLPASARTSAVGIGWIVGAVTLHVWWRGLTAKKALVYTPRMRRLLVSTGILLLLLSYALVVLVLDEPVYVAAAIVGLLFILTPSLSTSLVITANKAMSPIEARIRQQFVDAARERITSVNPVVIGIAGSYGKTSTKHIVAHLLSGYMETLATPKSFNTLMGVTRTINENLLPEHRAFVVEMDAYGKGEIATLSALVQPRIGVVTAVGPQHLERFGTMDAISDAMHELVAALPSAAPAIMYVGDSDSNDLAERATSGGYTVIRYGLDGTADRLDVAASDVHVDQTATRFTWRWVATGEEYRVTIPLLGQHNVLNVSAALAVVHSLGYPLAKAVERAMSLESVPHRLQLMPNSNGITIIDDSYNANPVGIHNGLDVLQQMTGRSKILVTPGLVELGAVEELENTRVGEHAARVCDHVILVGARQTEPINKGLQRGGFSADNIHVVQSLEEVTATLGRITTQGDVVLFANDLPDVYLELK